MRLQIVEHTRGQCRHLKVGVICSFFFFYVKILPAKGLRNKIDHHLDKIDASLQSMHKNKWRQNVLDTSIHALWMWNQQAHCFNFKQHTRTQESHCTSPSPPAKWLTEHRHYHTTWKAFSSNSCDSWPYSRSWWSVSYLCRGSLVLLPRCSAPPPLFPGRAREERNEPQKEGMMLILGTSRC